MTKNGNIFKGNKGKKGLRTRKEEYAIFDPELDQFAKVVKIEGGKHISVQILKNSDNDTLETKIARIRGLHFKKVWYKKDDLVVVRQFENILEVQGKVSEHDMSNARIANSSFMKANNLNEGNNVDELFSFDDL